MKIPSLLAILCLLAPLAHAQERTATGTLDNQASWAALKSLTEQANTNAQTAHIRLNQWDICAKQGMLYAPGEAGANAQGCKAVATPKNCTWHNLPQGQHNLVCPAPKVMSGMAYEPATWSNDRDSHSMPEIYAALCCAL